jgi:hypothetical protein
MSTVRYALDSPQLQAILPRQDIQEGYQATQEILAALQRGDLKSRKKGDIEAWIGEVKTEQKARRSLVECTRQYLASQKLEAAVAIYQERYHEQLDQTSDASVIWFAADLLVGDRVILELTNGPWVEVLCTRLRRLGVQATAVAMGRAVEFTQQRNRYGQISPSA